MHFILIFWINTLSKFTRPHVIQNQYDILKNVGSQTVLVTICQNKTKNISPKNLQQKKKVIFG